MICRNKMAVFAVIAVMMCMVWITDVFAAQLKKTIAVSKFENNTNYPSQSNLGSGMADQLKDALMNSGNFVVVERQTLGDVMGEQEDLAIGGRAAQPKTAQTDKLVPAQVLIKGTVTQFGLRKDSRSSGVGYGTSDRGSPWQSSRGGVGGFPHPEDESYKAHVAVTLHLIDATSGEDLYTLKVKEEATTRSIKRFGFGTRGFEKTPLGKVLQKTIDKAVTKIAKRLRKIPFAGKIIKVEEGTIYTDIGARNGVTVGETFDVYAVEEPVDSDAGKTRSSKKTKAGSIVITSVKQKYSKAAPEAGGFFKNGYIVTK